MLCFEGFIEEKQVEKENNMKYKEPTSPLFFIFELFESR